MQPQDNLPEKVSTHLQTLQDRQKEIFLDQAAGLPNADVAVRIMQACYEDKLMNLPLASDSEGESDAISVITQIRAMFGAGGDTTATQLEIEARYLKNNYRDYSLSDVYLAVEMFLNNRLDVEVPSYVKFSPLFLAHVMNAYIRYKKTTMMQVAQQSETKILMLEEQVNADRVKGLKECIRSCYHHSADGYKSERFFNSMVYECLKLSRRLTISLADIEQAKKYGKETYAERIKEVRERQKLKVDAIPVGEALKMEPAAIYDKARAINTYGKDYLLMKFFKGVELDKLLDSITEKDLLKYGK